MVQLKFLTPIRTRAQEDGTMQGKQTTIHSDEVRSKQTRAPTETVGGHARDIANKLVHTGEGSSPEINKKKSKKHHLQRSAPTREKLSAHGKTSGDGGLGLQKKEKTKGRSGSTTSCYDKRSQGRGIGLHAKTHVGGSQVAKITCERIRTSMDTPSTKAESENLGRNR